MYYFLYTVLFLLSSFCVSFFKFRQKLLTFIYIPCFVLKTGGSKSRVPIVGVLLEGGTQTFRTVFELVTGRNPVPIVVCDGSGRAADLLAFMHRYANEDG